MKSEQNIFTWIKSKLSQDYGGRYFGAIVQATLLSDPKFSYYLFEGFGKAFATGISRGLKANKFTVSLEWSFTGSGGKKRRADIAILHADDELRPAALVEIKDEDHKSYGNEAQTKDYLRLLKKHPDCKFLLLSKHAPRESTTAQLNKNLDISQSVLWNEIHLRARRDERSLVIDWMLQFIEGESMIYHDQINERALRYLMRGGLNLPGTGSVGKVLTVDAIKSGPEQMGHLHSNADMLCRYVQDLCGEGFTRAPKPYFYFTPWIKKDVRGESDGFEGNLKKSAMYFPGGRVIGGEALFGSRAALTSVKGSEWSAIEVYYFVEVGGEVPSKRKKADGKRKVWKLNIWLEVWAGTNEKDSANFRSKSIDISKKALTLRDAQNFVSKSAKSVIKSLAVKHPNESVRKRFLSLHKALQKNV